MTKNTYLEVGSFDSFYYAVVYEDEATCGLINRNGVEIIKQVPICDASELLDPEALIHRMKKEK